jgi:YegS/Rv2252/BmrU family lipid kinase
MRAVQRLRADVEIRLTERAGHAHELALEAAAAGADLVIAWGGDGTINEVGRALAQRMDEGPPSPRRQAPALGIVPGGSGNGLARALGIPFEPEKAIERALRAEPRTIDAGELGERMFFNIAGIGLDAHVAALVSTKVRHRGFVPYLKGVAGDLLRYEPVEYAGTIDGRAFRTSALFVAVANSKQYGFGAEIAPRANLADGLIDVVIVEDRGLLGNLLRVPSLFLRNVDCRDGIIAMQAELTIEVVSHATMSMEKRSKAQPADGAGSSGAAVASVGGSLDAPVRAAKLDSNVPRDVADSAWRIFGGAARRIVRGRGDDSARCRPR